VPRLIGWREWAALPDLGIKRIKLKADTGARTSALHALAIRSIKKNDEEWVEFQLDADEDPIQAKVIDHRNVKDSGGREEIRVTVETTLRMDNTSWPIELTLTDRDAMGFRMLLGRTAMQDRFYVDSSASYLLGSNQKKRNSGGADKQLREEEE